MHHVDAELRQGLRALRAAVADVLLASAALSSSLTRPPQPALAAAPRPGWPRHPQGLLMESLRSPAPDGRGPGGHRSAVSPGGDPVEGERLVALVELARGGDAEAFGLLYDHYQPSIYRFLVYRVGSVALAEDLTSETFFRALRSLGSFRWQGKDFGAWLTTIARNLATDHAKSGRSRLEVSTEDMTLHDSPTEGPEDAVLAAVTTDALLAALRELPDEQQECLVLRFLQSRSIAETAATLGRSEGAVKQLQLRAVRNLAKRLPEGLR